MSEKSDALKLAERLLDEPYCDPDDDLRVLSRQLLRRQEVVERVEKRLAETMDPTRDLIEANRDTILNFHEEAIRRIRKCLTNVMAGPVAADSEATRTQCRLALQVIVSLNLFHPMHGESWCGWPQETDATPPSSSPPLPPEG